MMDRFRECLRVVLNFEGGLSDDPDDRGGRTNLGITQGTLDGARKNGITLIKTVDALTADESAKIYKALYWDRCKCDKLPHRLDLITFDCAVNCGVGTAGKCLQRGLCDVGRIVAVDGAIGPKTVDAAVDVYVSGKLDKLLRACLDRRMEYYGNIIKARPSQKKFLRGWTNRVNALARIAGV